MSTPTGVVLLTFGSAVTSDDVPEYMRSVRGRREPSAEVVDEFRMRYDVIGRSPLIDITLAQAAALQRLLDDEHGPGALVVRAGMQHSEPRIAVAVDELVTLGAHRVVGVVLAPQYSPIILAGYERAATAARDAHPDLDLRIAGAWHTMPAWIDSLSDRLRAALHALPPDARDAPVIFTAHSLPRSVVDRDPGYIDQLRETAAAVAARTALAATRWQFAYQSAGHTPEPWLTPDVKDLLPGLRERGVRTVVVAPVQFLADHLEILYDIDVAAVREARDLGIEMRRIEMPNASPGLVTALAAVVRRELEPAGATQTQRL
ncbi:MAG: ferrochelatase [Candidatus Dormibacteraeota bacterium]|nr:ferrochelatase [Candidatus Dormibacteraeota bacterium]